MSKVHEFYSKNEVAMFRELGYSSIMDSEYSMDAMPMFLYKKTVKGLKPEDKSNAAEGLRWSFNQLWGSGTLGLDRGGNRSYFETLLGIKLRGGEVVN